MINGNGKDRKVNFTVPLHHKWSCSRQHMRSVHCPRTNVVLWKSKQTKVSLQKKFVLGLQFAIYLQSCLNQETVKWSYIL